MLDTNIFNRLLDGLFSLDSLADGASFYATRIQIEELSNTIKPERRERLLDTFSVVKPELVPAAFSLDVPGAGWDEGQWQQRDDVIVLQQALEAEKADPNNWQDALVASAAADNQCVLVTADQRLVSVCRAFDIPVEWVEA